LPKEENMTKWGAGEEGGLISDVVYPGGGGLRTGGKGLSPSEKETRGKSSKTYVRRKRRKRPGGNDLSPVLRSLTWRGGKRGGRHRMLSPSMGSIRSLYQWKRGENRGKRSPA